jgi:hypothetical protein
MKTFAVIVLIGLCVFLVFRQHGEQIADRFGIDLPWATKTVVEPKPSETFGFENTITPQFKDKHELGMMMSGLLDGLADVVELDGKKPVPNLKTLFDVFDMQIATVDFDKGKTVKSEAPEVFAALKAVFTKEWPDGAKPLDTQARQKMVNVFRAAAWASRKVN